MATETAPSTAVDELDHIPEMIAPTPKSRRKNLVEIELSEQGKALAVLLSQTEEELVADAVKAHVGAMTDKLRGVIKQPF